MNDAEALPPLDPYALAALADPAGHFDRYRSLDPVHRGRPLQPGSPACWYLTRYDDVTSVIRGDSVGHARPRRREGEAVLEGESFSIDDVLDRWFVFMDGDEHRRLRSVLARPLRALAGPATRERLMRQSHALIDRYAAGTVDLLPTYAYPFPVIAMAELIGFPQSDHPRLIAWAQTFIQVFDLRNDHVVRAVRKAFEEFFDYLRSCLAARAGGPSDDLLGVLERAAAEGAITHNELLCSAALLLLAGAETTPTLIGNSILLLLSHPDACEAVRADENLAPGAVDEVMRFESPVQLTGRQALRDFEVGGKPIARGDYVVALYGAANRDPSQFADPHRFDIRRSPNRHLGFGTGVHACVGAALGHVIGQVAVTTLLERLPGMRLDEPAPDWRGHGSIRGLRTLRLRIP